MKFRIIEKTEKFADGTEKSKYHIQKLILGLFWVKAYKKEYAWGGNRVYSMNRWIHYTFSDEDSAKKYKKEFHESPTSIWYEGYKIIKTKIGNKTVYIDKTDYIIDDYAGKTTYGYEGSLEKVKERINKKNLVSKTKRVID